MLASSAPLLLAITLSACVATWQHVVVHTYTTAQSMHIGPVALLTCISTCTGVVFFFIWMLLHGVVDRALGLKSTQKYEYHDHHASSTGAGDDDDGGWDDDDIDRVAYLDKAVMDSKRILKDTPDAAGLVVVGDVLTVTMVWTNVYGLGLAAFFLGYISVMASTLASFSFVVGLSAVSIYEAMVERAAPSHMRWGGGTEAGMARAAMHIATLVLSLGSMISMGVHTAGIHTNTIGNVRVEDVLLGIVGPALTPLLLKGVRRPHTTMAGMLETALPFTFMLCAMFLSVAIAMGMRPYESGSELGRNLVASTVLIPLWGGLAMVCTLRCAFRRRMLYVLSAYMVVYAGREFTVNRGSKAVAAAFAMSMFGFIASAIASSRRFITVLTGGEGRGLAAGRDVEEPVGAHVAQD